MKKSSVVLSSFCFKDSLIDNLKPLYYGLCEYKTSVSFVSKSVKNSSKAVGDE
ncbi:MAG: hypothetical protein QG564_1420 [Campylobacterota bacterium]|nr:hypothetical protein [Campylobacterota bacterium]